MKETIQLKSFLKTGNFGEHKEITIGMDRSVFTQILGESKWVLINGKSKYPSIYKYDLTEFYFEEGINGKLYGIQIKPTIQVAPKLNLKINYDILQYGITYNSIIKTLEPEQIDYELFRSKYDDEDSPHRILTSGEVTLIFDDGFELEKISKFRLDNKTRD